MYPFEYKQASSVEAGVKVGGDGKSKYLAGGTTLIDLMKLNVERPRQIVDITPLPLANITELPSGGLSIGGLVRNSDLANHPLVKQRYPVLSEALLSGASPQLRNMATTGGNILQRTRCYYFRDTSQPCNKRQPGSGCSAIGGHNRMHAVLGTSGSCIATHASDMCVAMAALDAVVVIQGSGGERRINFVDFHLEPGSHPDRETVLKPGEIITAVELPALPLAARSHYYKVRDRASYAFALSSAAAALQQDATGTITNARVALGGVGTKPWRSKQAEQFLIGKAPTKENFRAAAEIALKDAKGYGENDYKIELAKRTLVRTLTTVSKMA